MHDFVVPRCILSQHGFVTESVPAQVWFLLLLATIGIGPAAYVWRHVAQAATPHDITQPPDDLSWRTTRQLYVSLAILAGLLAAAGLAFTPLAVRIAQSEAFVPSLLGAVGSYALGAVANGWRKKRIEPILRGFSQVYDRDGHPVRYWLSLGWNASLGISLLVASFGLLNVAAAPQCDDAGDDAALVAALESCNVHLAKGDIDSDRRATLLAARGRVHHRLGIDVGALADYSAALALNPDNSYALYNRGLVYQRTGDPWSAIKDFSVSLELRPDNDEAYLNRGIAYLDIADFPNAIEDFSTLESRVPDHPYALANRGIAHAWQNNRELAERDFRRMSGSDPGWEVVLRGRAILAMHERDYDGVVNYLSQSLVIDPDNAFALRMRADAYWRLGEHELARDDDDRLAELDAPPRQRLVQIIP